jgi:hypothetical protein
MKKIRISRIPHPSYDIDGDGWVSQEDYRLAKRFDFDGNGVIDPDERMIAKHVIANEFFDQNKHQLREFGGEIAQSSVHENVAHLENSQLFEKNLRRLKAVEESLRSRGSTQMARCMAGDRPELTKFNFYNNKYDTTAWNDFEAVPRQRFLVSSNPRLAQAQAQARGHGDAPPHASLYSGDLRGSDLIHHNGSRKQLLRARKEATQMVEIERFEAAFCGRPQYRTKKLALISDFQYEN